MRNLIVGILLLSGSRICAGWLIDGYLTLLDREAQFLSVRMLDSDHGWALSPTRLHQYRAGEWVETNLRPAAVSFSSLEAINANELWIACDGSTIIQSVYGIALSRQYEPITSLTALSMSSSTSGLAAGWGIVFRKNDTAWVRENLTGYYSFTSVHQIDAVHAWMVGRSMIPEETANYLFEYAGSGWRKLETGVTKGTLNGVFALDTNDVWIVGDGGLIRHYENGSMSIVSSPTSHHLNALAFFDRHHGWAVGDSGTILGYNGTDWNVQVSPSTVPLTSLSVVDSVNVWIGGAIGVILRTSDGGWVNSEKKPAGKVPMLHVAPNPYTSAIRINIDNPVSEKVQLNLLTCQGRLVARIWNGLLPAGTKDFSLGTSKLANGTYILSLQSESEARHYKITLAR